MNFHYDPKDLSLLARVVIYVLLYLEGVLSGLWAIVSSLVRMTWEITWPVMARPVRRIWPEFGWYKEDKEWLPWCDASYDSKGPGKGHPFEICRRSADWYVITRDGWLIDIFTSDLADRLLRWWVPTEAELEAAERLAAKES